MQAQDELRGELLDSCNELCDDIEVELDKLARNQGGDLNGLFRSIHSIKGNAAMVQLDDIVSFTHSLEDLFVALRDHKLSATRHLCEALRYGIEKVRDMHLRDICHQEVNLPCTATLNQLYHAAASAEQAELDAHCLQIIALFNGEDVIPETSKTEPLAIVCLTQSGHPTKASFDLEFFSALATQVDKQSRYWTGRTEQLHNWAQRLNEIRGCPVNPEQLSAAVYIHDIGMCYLDNEILDKKGSLSADELKELRQHPSWGYHYLLRVQGWDEAATMVLEHHERIDGGGYPNGNKGELINEGSKLLAVVDAFFSITNSRADRTQRRSTIKAISEINSCAGTQFDEAWVLAFNDLLKDELRSGGL